METEGVTTIELELPEGEVEPKIVTPNEDDPIAALKKQYDDLKAQDEERAKQLEQARQSEAKAQDEARRLATEAERANTRIAGSELNATANAIAAEQGALEAAKRDYRAAYEAGDPDKMADAQERIATAATNKVALEREKARLEASRPTTEGRVQQPQLPDDPVERMITISSLQGHPMSPRAQAFLREHREIATDSLATKKVGYLHEEAVRKGLPVESDDYYAHIEEGMGYRQKETHHTTQPQSRPRSMPAAPPSRDNGSATSGGTRVDVALTEGERKSAVDGTLVWNSGPNKGKPIGLEEMAKRKYKLTQEGKYKNINLN